MIEPTVIFCDSSIREMCTKFIDEDPVVTEYPETVTNNVGEYKAVIDAIKQLTLFGYTQATIYTDSQLVVFQVRGQDDCGRLWTKCKPHLQIHRDHVRELLDNNPGYVLKWIPREHNPAGKRLEEIKRRKN